ncbi:cation transporter [bacterium]|nr:cation transporter [bacterium]
MATADRERQIRRITVLGLIINLALAGVKLAAGMLGHSRALVADSVHSLSDCATDVMLLVGSRLWARPRDDDHPYGHARIETLITVLVGLLLAGVGIGIGVNAVTNLHEQHSETPGAAALAAALFSIIVKEWLYRHTMRVGRAAHSSAVVANAWHHRSDALSSVPAFLAVGGAMLWPAWSFLDHVGAGLICLLILQAAWRIIGPAVGQLIDTGLPRKDAEDILKAVQGCDGVEDAHDLRTRRLGSGVAVDLHVAVEPTLSVAEGHDIAEAVRHTILDHFPDVIDVVVHIDPAGMQGD